VAVVVSFFICWLPFHVQRLSTVYVDLAYLTPTIMHLFTVIFYVSGWFYGFNLKLQRKATKMFIYNQITSLKIAPEIVRSTNKRENFELFGNFLLK